jgi:hypothetical protein
MVWKTTTVMRVIMNKTLMRRRTRSEEALMAAVTVGRAGVVAMAVAVAVVVYVEVAVAVG